MGSTMFSFSGWIQAKKQSAALGARRLPPHSLRRRYQFYIYCLFWLSETHLFCCNPEINVLPLNVNDLRRHSTFFFLQNTKELIGLIIKYFNTFVICSFFLYMFDVAHFSWISGASKAKRWCTNVSIFLYLLQSYFMWYKRVKIYYVNMCDILTKEIFAMVV